MAAIRVVWNDGRTDSFSSKASKDDFEKAFQKYEGEQITSIWFRDARNDIVFIPKGQYRYLKIS